VLLHYVISFDLQHFYCIVVYYINLLIKCAVMGCINVVGCVVVLVLVLCCGVVVLCCGQKKTRIAAGHGVGVAWCYLATNLKLPLAYWQLIA
jgi:hypothetical protein